VVFIENVGNLVCPANYDLGEHRRIVVLSVAEGTDKAAKYPGMFSRADMIVINKIDLMEHCDFDAHAATQYIRRVNDKAPILAVSARNGGHVDAVVSWIREQQCTAPAKQRSSVADR
jgi:hydrogenase nickel incorporation protein HypB